MNIFQMCNVEVSVWSTKNSWNYRVWTILIYSKIFIYHFVRGTLVCIIVFVISVPLWSFKLLAKPMVRWAILLFQQLFLYQTTKCICSSLHLPFPCRAANYYLGYANEVVITEDRIAHVIIEPNVHRINHLRVFCGIFDHFSENACDLDKIVDGFLPKHLQYILYRNINNVNFTHHLIDSSIFPC